MKGLLMAYTITQGPIATGTIKRERLVTTSQFGPAYQAYQILHVAFSLAPLIAGLDKFFNYLAHWQQYLSPQFARLSPWNVMTTMKVVGAVEILAGFLVAIKPRIGAYLVAAWMLGIIVNLLLIPGYFDIALRDLGLCLGALALGRLSAEFD
jgi:hypothetical protein